VDQNVECAGVLPACSRRSHCLIGMVILAVLAESCNC
jgi:hypothetical protein